MPGTPVENAFTSVTDGSSTIASTSPRDQLRVTGTGAATVAVSTPAGVPTLTVNVPADVPEVPPNSYFVGTGGYATLEAAVAALGSTPATVSFSTDQTLTGNLAIPLTMDLDPRNGAIINTNGFTLTGLKTATPELFARNTTPGTTDMTAAITKAAQAAPVVVMSAPYAANAVTLSDRTVTFEFKQGASVKATTVDGTVFMLTDCVTEFVNPVIKGDSKAAKGIRTIRGTLNVAGGDISGFASATTMTAGVFVDQATRMTVSGVAISNVTATTNSTIGDDAGAARAVYALSSANVLVKDNVITDITGEEGDSIQIANGCTNVLVEGNTVSGFTRRGIKIHSAKTVVRNNIFRETTVGATAVNPVAAIAFIPGSEGSSAIGNDIESPSMPYGIYSEVDDTTISGNRIVSGPKAVGDWTVGENQRAILAVGDNTTIVGNKTVSGYYGIEARKSSCVAQGNTVTDAVLYAIRVGATGAASMASAVNGNTIETTSTGLLPSSAIVIVDHSKGTFTGNTLNSFGGETNSIVELAGTSTGNDIRANNGNQQFSKVNVGSTTGNLIDGALIGSATYDPPNLVNGASTTTTVTVQGATVGMRAEASFGTGFEVFLNAYVSASNTVTVRWQNTSGVTLDVGSGTLYVRVTPNN